MQEQGNEANREEIDTFRELIVGPEKKEREGQLKGMKDLFTAMLVENKKEYDTQVSDMKELFVDVLDENRRVFQVQLQELYKTLPTLINKSVHDNSKQDIVVVNESFEARRQLDSYSRIDAIKQILLGFDIDQISKELKLIQVEVEKGYQEDQKYVLSLAEQISSEIDKMEERVSKKLNNLCEDLAKKMKINDEKQAHKEDITNLLINIVNQI